MLRQSISGTQRSLVACRHVVGQQSRARSVGAFTLHRMNISTGEDCLRSYHSRANAAATEAAQLIPEITLSNGEKLPQLGFGTWRITPDEATESAVEAAIKAGYRHIDCAKAYGNEEGVKGGIANATRGGVRTRDELYIASKLFNTDHARDDVFKACQESLDKLGLSYLNLYLVHWPATDKTGPELDPPYKETWRAMEDLVDKGMCRSIGVSNMTAKKLEDLLSYARIKPVVNQVEVHPYWRNTQTVEFCKKNDIHVTAYSPLGSIAATKESGQRLVVDDPTVKEIAEKVGKTPAQVILRWQLQQGISFIPKAGTNSHIVHNLHIFDFELTDDYMKRLSSLEHQERTCNGDFVISEEGPYHNFDELWDGEGH